VSDQMIFAQAEATGGGLGSLLFLVVMVAVFWLLFIRPQRRRMKQQQELQSSLQVGDTIQTIGGIFGRILHVGEDGITVEVESGRLKVTKKAIASKVNQAD